MEDKQFEIQLPESWHELSIGKFQEISTYKEDTLQNTINIISCLSEIDEEDLKQLDAEGISEILKTLHWMQTPPPADFKHVINIDGVDYSLIPKFSEITVGEQADLESYCDDYIGNLHKIFGILYRPLLSAANDRDRIIKKYDANECLKNAELFKEKMSIGDAYGAVLFFFLIGARFTQSFAKYLEKQMMEESSQTTT